MSVYLISKYYFGYGYADHSCLYHASGTRCAGNGEFRGSSHYCPFICFLFWYFIDDYPPVALSVFAAVSVSGVNTLKVTWQAIKLGIAVYIIPFIFLFNPALALVGGTTVMKLVVILFTTIAVYLIGVSFEGYAVNNKLSMIERILFPIIALVLIIPNSEMRNQSLMIIKIVGSAIAFFFIFSLGRKNKRLLKPKTV